MTLYEAVYTRKSIRNFRKDKVETSILEGMIQFYHEMGSSAIIRFSSFSMSRYIV